MGNLPPMVLSALRASECGNFYGTYFVNMGFGEIYLSRWLVYP
jgi:hypothetical protein